MPLLVATRPGGPVRVASKQEKCRHIWVDTNGSMGSSEGPIQFQRCINCNKSGSRPITKDHPRDRRFI